jgi:hypothetical protein
MLGLDTSSLEAPGRLCTTARRDTGQSRRVADFLLAWYNAAENGGWDPTDDAWNVDTAVAKDILGFEPEITAIWRLGPGPKPPGD